MYIRRSIYLAAKKAVKQSNYYFRPEAVEATEGRRHATGRGPQKHEWDINTTTTVTQACVCVSVL